VYRRIYIIALLGVAATTLGSSVIAVASAPGPVPPPAPHAASASQMTLAQAPPGLRTAARSAFMATGPYEQRTELTASDGAARDTFGWSVAISGSTAIVGSPFHSSNSGAAYVFVNSGTVWSQQAELTASDGAPNDEFGYSVALSGPTAVVGAFLKNSGTGAAYIFAGSGSTWTQQAKLTASDAAIDEFGYRVAISGLTAVVGAPGKNSATGAAYVFAGSGSSWTQQAKVTASDGAANDNFGDSVAIAGSAAVVGADGKNSATGAAYVFANSGSSWTQQAKLNASDGAASDSFGFSVAISGSNALIGARGKNSLVGAVYVFARSGTAWSQQAELTASDGAPPDNFGFSVAISGTTALIGAPEANSTAGAAYVFVGAGSTWAQQAKVIASGAASGDGFGASVAISGFSPIVGAPNRNSVTGAAYVYVKSRNVRQSSPGSPPPRDPVSQSTPGSSGPRIPATVPVLRVRSVVETRTSAIRAEQLNGRSMD
jgi:hypothetical protein